MATNGISHVNGTLAKVITCRAAVAYDPGQPLVVEQVQVDPPQKMEVRIKILFTSICHTDLSAWKGEFTVEFLGHEASGGGERVTEGDHVVPIFNGEFVYCKSSKKTNLCGKFRVNPFESVMASDGKCSEYTVVDSACLVKIYSNAPLDKMTLLSCGVVEGARTRGASKIIGVDINPEKRIKGQAIGITDFINAKEIDVPVHERIREMTEGGVHYSFECAGNLDVLREAFLSTHDGWGMAIVL
ncbi:hypothetical protein K7X08_013434 [Anisodus acutangulus]|uniref:Alcohol dehydrogenase n=1 Tax=Anisodus acutangulus TaxID=402998 RepID=A0A9Q1MG46_9SOLA|nr:hypothetical protein K7X08_013434 [Anisodus acutangulus]